MYAGSNYELYLQSLAGFLIILFVFVPFLKWAFTSKSHKEFKKLKRELRKESQSLKSKVTYIEYFIYNLE
jgi:succinate dehydrogenase/fumarate reductase cytochrome b subunit